MDIARQFSAVLLVLATLGASLWVLRRRSGSGRAGWIGSCRGVPRSAVPALSVIGRIHLTPHHSLHVVRAGAREWVVAAHPQGCTVISERAATGAAA